MMRLATLLAVLAATLVAGPASSAPAKQTPPKPTIVLLHGAWADSSAWSRVVERLQAKGDTVVQLATQQPGSAIGGDPAQTFDFVPIPGAPGGDFDLYVKQSLFPSAF